MRFRVLGPMQVWDGSQWAAIRAPQQRTVLALLLIESGRPVTSERLIDEIWEGRPPATAMGTIQGYVLKLRRLLGDDQHSLLATHDRGYQLMIEDDDLDVAVFEKLVESGRQRMTFGDLETGVAALVEALALWRGAPLADILPCATVVVQAQRLAEVHLNALEECLGAQLELGHHADVVDQLHWLVREHPLRETLWRHLLLALHRCGRRAEALDAYQRARKLLAAELGVEPDRALRELHAALLTEDPRLGSASPKEPRQQGFTPVVPAQLPARPAAFTGRREQLEQLDALLALEALAPAIVTVVGPAGVGKTALALHWAHRITDRFDDGRLYVNLRGFDPGGPPMAPAEALRRFLGALNVPAQHIPADPDAQAALYRSLLAGKKILILLDNARDPVQVRALLPGAPGCLVMITSRNDMSHQTLAHVWELQDRHTEALAHCRQALDLFRTAGHQSGQADALDGIGWLHALLGDHRHAIAYCRQALPLYQEVGDRRGQAATWDSLGYAHHHLGLFPQAVECYQQAINLCREDGDRYEEVSMTRLGDTHNAAGSLHAARVAWQQALATLTDLDHPDAEQVRAKLAGLGADAGAQAKWREIG